MTGPMIKNGSVHFTVISRKELSRLLDSAWALLPVSRHLNHDKLAIEGE